MMRVVSGRWSAASIAAVLALGLLVAFPFVASPYLQGLAVVALLYATVAASWDITLGYAGLFNLAHLAFFGVGAYVSGMLTHSLGIDPWLGVVAAAAGAAVTAAIVYLPVSRLRGIYVSLVTFAFTQLVLRFVLSAAPLTGGQSGFTQIPPLMIGGVALVGRSPWSIYLAGGLLVATVVVLRAFVRSDHGTALVALRDGELYAISRGVSVLNTRLLAFVVSAVFTGAAGAVYTHYLGALTPGVLDFSLVTLLLSMVLVGGSATIYGPVAAALVLGISVEWLGPIGPFRFIIVALLVLVTVILFPSGAWGAIGRLRGAFRWGSGRSSTS